MNLLNRTITKKTFYLLVVLYVLLMTGAEVQAQFSAETFQLQKSSEQYDERGFLKGKSLNMDDNLIVNNSNGNVSYSYPISNSTKHGYPISVTLNYCGSVGFTAFQSYRCYYNIMTTDGWSKFTQNKPLWIIGLNGFAVQTLSQNTEPIQPLQKVTQYITYISTAGEYEPSVWLVDGYDYSNKMRDFSAGGDIAENRIDIIRLLRSDGSLLELCHKADSSSSRNPETDSSLYSGKYFEKGSNSKGYAYVELQETRPQSLWSEYDTTDFSASITAPINMSRIVHYFPGDGLEYIFKEDLIPYGSQFYVELSLAGIMNGSTPSIFYLTEIRSERRSLVELHYADEEQDGQAKIMKGRKQLQDFWGHHFSFGGYRARIEAFGKTTELYLDTVLRSPLPNIKIDDISTTIWEPTSHPMVRRIVNPAGQQVSFQYESRTRTYTEYKWPHKYNLTDCSIMSYDPVVRTKTKRMKRFNEPAAYTELSYHGDTTGYETIESNSSASRNLYLLSEVAKKMVKKDYTGSALWTKEFMYEGGSDPSSDATEWQTLFTMRDEKTNKETWNTNQYKRRLDQSMFAYVPGRAFTDLVKTVEGSDALSTETTTSYDYLHSGGGDSLLNLRYPVSRRVSEYVYGDTSTRVTKSYSTYNYVIDTAIRFTDSIAKHSYSYAVKRIYENVMRPDSITKLLYRKVTDYQIFPDSLQTNYIFKTWNKQKSLAAYFELKASDPSFTKTWEECLMDGDTRVIKGNGTDTVMSYPPLAILEKGSYITDSNSVILQGKSKRFSSIISTRDLSNSLDRTAILADTVFGLGGVNYVQSNIAYNTYPMIDIQMPHMVSNSVGSRSEYIYAYYDIPPAWNCPMDNDSPEGKIHRNDNTDSIGLFTGSEQLYYWHDPLGEAKRIRRYYSYGGGIDTMYLPTLYDVTYYGLHRGIIDANGWLTSARYDKIGRLLYYSAPYDYNSSSRLVEYDKSIDIHRAYGYTVMEVNRHQSRKVPPCPSSVTEYRTVTDTYYDYTTLHAERLYSIGGGGSGSARKGEKTLGPCDQWTDIISDTPDTSYHAVIPFGFSCTHIESLDSVALEISPELIDPCFTLNVKVLKSNGLSSPTEYTFSPVAFTCDSSFSDTTFEQMSDTGLVNGDHRKLRFLFPSGLVSSIAGSSEISFDVILSAGTSFKAGYFAQNGEDVQTQVKLYGIFSTGVDLTDYTLRYEYEDYYGSSATWQRSKIDDSLHTSNTMASSGSASDNKRIVPVAHTFSGDGSLTSSSVYHGNPVSNIKDMVSFVNNGFGKPIQTTDQLGYISRVLYDEFGRVIQSNNPDNVPGGIDTNTSVRIGYDIGPPSKFGLQRVLSDADYQDWYGYVSMQSDTNESQIIFTKYKDAFGRLRREIADSGDANHLNLLTLYDYDVQGRLTRVVNPEGQITDYWYDEYGRVKYKRQPDIGIISYAYDKAGNVRFTQTSEQDSLGRVTFHEYDDLNRITIVGEARLTNTEHGDLPDLNRLTDVLDPDILHDDGQSGILTSNRTLWTDSSSSTPYISNHATQSACLPEVTYDAESYSPSGTTMLMPIPSEVSDVLTLTGTSSFENLGKNTKNVRIAIYYDTLPSRTGSIWGHYTPADKTDIWHDLSPTGSVRNMKGHEVAVAYREKVNEPFHYVVMSYDERGRVEALLRYTGNIGFDAVYYRYNSANQVIRLITADGQRQHCTWYGYDEVGRMDSVWTLLGDAGTGLGFSSPGYPSELVKPLSPEIVYRYDKRSLVDSTVMVEPGVVQRYHYGARKWLDSMTAIAGSDTVFSQKLEFDKTGNITKQVSKQKDTSEIAMVYDYDRISRIKLWSTSGYSVMTGDRYSYDKVGNRVKRLVYDYDGPGDPAADTVNYSYGNGNNQLTQVRHWSKPETKNRVVAISN